MLKEYDAGPVCFRGAAECVSFFLVSADKNTADFAASEIALIRLRQMLSTSGERLRPRCAELLPTA